MSYVINCSPGHTSFVPNSTTGQPSGGKIGIVSKKSELPIELNEQIVLMDLLNQHERINEEKKDWYLFTFKGSIKTISDIRPAKREELNTLELYEYDNSRSEKNNREPINFYFHEYDVNLKDIFQENPFLDDYTYSLHGVFNYTQPYRHLSRKFTNVADFDFETLKKEQLFASRTVFGRLFYSLPLENQLEFLQLAIQEYRTTNFSNIPISKGVEFLYDYTKRIIQLGKILKATDKLLSDHFSDIVDIKEIGFEFTEKVTDSNKKVKLVQTGDQIQKQVALFDHAFQFEKGVEETIMAVIDPAQRRKENRFFEKFSDKTWPIKIDL